MARATAGARVRAYVDREWDPAGVPAFEVLRARLAFELGVAPHRVALHRRCETCGSPDHGRPRVDDRDVDVGIAHSGPVLIVAIAHGATVGVDVEQLGRRSPERIERLAARVLDARDLAEWLARSGPERRERAFLRAWTTKEAYLKARGVGLVSSLAQVDPGADGWHVHPLDALTPDAVGTIVTDRPATIELVDLTSLGPP